MAPANPASSRMPSTRFAASLPTTRPHRWRANRVHRGQARWDEARGQAAPTGRDVRRARGSRVGDLDERRELAGLPPCSAANTLVASGITSWRSSYWLAGCASTEGTRGLALRPADAQTLLGQVASITSGVREWPARSGRKPLSPAATSGLCAIAHAAVRARSNRVMFDALGFAYASAKPCRQLG